MEEMSGAKERLLKLLAEAVEDGDFVGASGRRLTHYLDCRKVLYVTHGMSLAVEALYETMRHIPELAKANSIGGPGFGAAPLVTGIVVGAGLGAWSRGFLVRESVKRHGKGGQIVGAFRPGDAVILLDDVATSGGSLLQAVDVLVEQQAKVLAAVVVVDREEGAREALENCGIPFYSLFRFSEILEKRKCLSQA